MLDVKSICSLPNAAVRLSLGISLGFALQFAHAQEWTAIGPFGADLRTINVSPLDDSFIIATTTLGVYVSRDHGESWQTPSIEIPGYPSQTQSLQDVAFHPSEPGSAYLIFDRKRLFRTNDAGATWVEVLNLPDAVSNRYSELAAVVVEPGDPNRIFAYGSEWFPFGGGTAQSLRYTSIDNGDSWTTDQLRICPHMTPSVRSVAFDDRTPRLRYEISPEPCDVSPPPLPEGFSIFEPDGSEVRRSFVLPPSGNDAVRAATKMSIFGAQVHVLADGSLYETLDQGQSWTVLRSGILDFTQPSANFILTIEASGIFRSIDSGSTWSMVTSTVDELASIPPTAGLAVQGNARILAGTATGVARSVDGGATWNHSVDGFGELSTRAVAVSADGLQIWAGIGEGRSFAGAYPGLFLSTDGGQSWRQSDLGTRATAVRDVAVDPLTWLRTGGPRVYASGLGCGIDAYTCSGGMVASRGAYVSDDGGMTWRDIEAGLPFIPARTRPLRTSRTVLIGGAATANGLSSRVSFGTSGDSVGWLIASSSDGAISFSAGTGIPITNVGVGVSQLIRDPFVSQRVLAGVVRLSTFATESYPAGVYASDDDGESWHEASVGLPIGSGTPSYLPDVFSIAADQIRPGRFWAAARIISPAGDPVRTAVYRSTDHGRSWSECSGAPQTENYLRMLATDGRDPNLLFAVDSGPVDPGGGAWVSRDGCQTWQRLGPELPRGATEIVVRGDEVLLGSGYGVLRMSIARDALLVNGFE